MEVPNGLVKKLLRQPLKQIKEFDDYYAQQGEKLGLRTAQRLLERVRWHTSNRDQPVEFYKQVLEHYLWNRDQRWALYREIFTLIQFMLNFPAPVDDYSTLPLGQIERNFESIDFRQAEINEFLWNEPINHTEVLFWKMFTWYKAKIHVSKERPNRTEYLQQMDDLVDHLEVFTAQGLEDLQNFDESYAFYKEDIHLRNAQRALEKVRYGSLNRDQRNVHYREILDNLQEILDLPGPVEDYSELTLEETRNLMRSVGERSAEMDRLFEADERNQIGLIGNVSNIFIWTKTAVIDTYEGIKTKIGMINFPFLS